MILILLLEVRNLKNIIKLTRIITATITIVLIMKTATAIKVVIIIKLIALRRHQPQKKLFILGDSMVKKLKGFLLTRKLNYKCLVKVRPFNSAKVRCKQDHVKPIVRDFDPDHIILHCGTNDLNSDRTSSQIAREIIDLAISLKSDKNKISISLLTPRSDKLNNKASEVNNRLINMCSHRNIAYIDHSSSIQQNHINESKVHLNRYGTVVFANTFSIFLSEYY